jgi:GntR family transcriptional regulator
VGGVVREEVLCSSDDATMNSTMFRVKVNRQEPTELHEQVAAEIRRAIADGEARPGERLPPAKDLAAVLDVNTNTVLRALRQLRDEGLLDFRRGRSVTVAGTPEQGAVVVRAKELVRFARQHGYRLEELIRIIEDIA